ncbi:hypothetical protein CYMTET_17660 [Cymbomonas tetramitiformis]|uniref:Uncharacterized protein n=1 Tax=Cymbomonas tetramitiformis TaxID=36881 RepID=A0AAE0CDE2_9CHLO|nr:hypothetical protein CYMTET_51057 [Cymbomonas tetramitiformis]KAK3253052.1 hypothetical protein CYMTET_37681 [Cymbomonas tetramitiformis]KAK3271046.1 hypothetical protein CYMTET_20588 [Cymbomonas tetramitiformis]KAK3274145.1 hypothetical protein CYMTET_17660 [Cymbomonas tetramitiformis]
MAAIPDKIKHTIADDTVKAIRTALNNPGLLDKATSLACISIDKAHKVMGVILERVKALYGWTESDTPPPEIKAEILSQICAWDISLDAATKYVATFFNTNHG